MAPTLPPMNQPPPIHSTGYRAGPQIYARPAVLKADPVTAPPPVSSLQANAVQPIETVPKPTVVTGTAGPVITVFIGNISERAPEAMIKKILATVGSVINWKRVSTFGFCEYE